MGVLPEPGPVFEHDGAIKPMGMGTYDWKS